MASIDDYLTTIANDRSLTNEQKNLISTHIPKFLISTTQTTTGQTQLLSDAEKYRNGTKR